MDELDIRETNEARNAKRMQISEIVELEDGGSGAVYECPVCGQDIKGGSDHHISAGIGNYHTDHLSDGEVSYLLEMAEDEEEDWERAANAERTAKQARAIYGDGYFSDK